MCLTCWHVSLSTCPSKCCLYSAATVWPEQKLLVVRWHQHTCGWLAGWLACLPDTLSSHSCCVDYLLLPSPNLLTPFRFVNCLFTFHIYIKVSSFSLSLSRVRSLFYVPPHSFSHSSYSTLSSSLILCRSVFFLHRLRFLFHFSLAHTHTLKKSAALQHIVLKAGKNNKIMTKYRYGYLYQYCFSGLDWGQRVNICREVDGYCAWWHESSDVLTWQTTSNTHHRNKSVFHGVIKDKHSGNKKKKYCGILRPISERKKCI